MITISLTFSQVTEIVSKIKTKSELDCKARDIVTIEEGDMDYNAALDKFANILSGDPGSNPIRGWLIFLSIFVRVVIFKSVPTMLFSAFIFLSSCCA